MGLFSFLSKNKQDSTASDSGYVSRDDDPAAALARSKRASNAGGGKNRRVGKDGADPVLPEKKRARRRLVGAIALALGVAVGLPMILDSEPKPLNNDIAIEIPSKERPAAPAASAPAVANANGLDPSEEVIDTKPAAVKPSPALAPPVVAEVKAQSEPVKEAAAAKPPKAEPFDMPKADAKAEAKARAEARARADAEAQLKAEQRAEARLAAAKPEPKHEAKPAAKVEDKPKPDDAARALAILEGKPAAKPADKPAEAGTHFVVQIAALATQEKVDELQNKLREAGIKSYTQKVPTPSGERIRVRMGPFSSRDEAEKARARLVKIGLNGSLVPA